MDITAAARDHDHGHLVVFNVAPYGLCAPAAEVEGIIVVPHIRPLPQAPPSTIGVVQHRGQVYRVISLRRKLGLESGPPLLEGQLILTRLAVGLTAFLVDEVVDVRPAEDFVRQPLSPHSPMDFFDAFLLRDEQIMLHTTFTQMEAARETPFPSPDLTAATTAAPMPSANNSKADQPESCEPQSTPSRPGGSAAQGTAAIRPSLLPERKIVPASPEKPPGPGPEKTPRPLRVTETPSVPRAPRPRIREVRPAGSGRPLRNHHRTRRYALTLTALLILLLFIVLSSTFWLKARLSSGGDPSRRGITRPTAVAIRHIPSKPLSAVSEKPLHNAGRTETRPLAQGDKRPPTGEEAPAASPPSPENRSTETIAAAVSPDSRLEQTTNRASEPLSPGSESSRQILRLDSDVFTLTVERPTAPPEEPDAPSGRGQLTPGGAITHRVVSGDTLWGIAADYLGDPFQYPELARLSRIRNPDLIYPGDIVRIRRKTPFGQDGTLPGKP